LKGADALMPDPVRSSRTFGWTGVGADDGVVVGLGPVEGVWAARTW
jgi:hypothetical protein